MLATTLIEIPSWGTMTLIEAIWLASGLLALIFTIFHIGPLYDDWRVSKLTGRLVLSKVAWGYVRREIIRMAQAVCLTTIGVYAAVTEPVTPGPAVVSVVGLVLTGVLLCLAFLVSLQSLLDWRTRSEVQDLIAHGENGHIAKEVVPSQEITTEIATDAASS